MEMRASQVIKGALGGGAKKKKKKMGVKTERKEGKSGERHLQIHSAKEVETGTSQLFSCSSSETSVEQFRFDQRS